MSDGVVGGPGQNLDPIDHSEAGSPFRTRPRLADHLPDGPTVRRRAGEVFGALVEGTLATDIAGRYGPDDRRIIGKPTTYSPRF